MSATLKDMVDQITEQKSGDQAPVQKDQRYRPFIDLMNEVQPDITKQNQIMKMLVGSGVFTGKDVTSIDIGPVRVESLYPVIAQIVNTEFKLAKMLLNRPVERVTDYRERIVEENVGDQTLPFFNMDGDLPPVYQSVLSNRFNTLGAFGQQIKLSFMADALAFQSPYKRNEFEAQVSAALNKVNRSLNSYTWANTEQTGEAIGQTPQPGGFYTRSTSNIVSAGGSNLTDALIAGRVSAMAASFGFDGLTDLVGFCHDGQLPILRNLMINRYPGTDPMSKLQYDNVLTQKAKAMGLTIDAIYESDNGKVIPFFRDEQMPANTSMIFRADLPQLGMFELGGNFGPHLIERPIATLYRSYVLFLLFTLLDPLVVSRSVITNLAS